MNVYYSVMLNKKSFDLYTLSYNKYIISKYKSSSYITNTINKLKGTSFKYNIFISFFKGLFYGFISFIIDEKIIKKIINFKKIKTLIFIFPKSL